MTIFWVDNDGAIVRATDDGVTDETLTGVKVPPSPAPESGKQKWLGTAWSSPPDRSTETLAKKQLNKDSMLGGIVVALAKRLEISEETLVDEIIAEVVSKKG
jgi:hypothetical protein